MQVFLHLGEALITCVWVCVLGPLECGGNRLNRKKKKKQLNFLQCLSLILNRKSCFMLPVDSIQPLLILVMWVDLFF